MSEILGHDCDGRPLRAGDSVRILPAAEAQRLNFLAGSVVSVIAKGTFFKNNLKTDLVLTVNGITDNLYVVGCYVRRLDADPDIGCWLEIWKNTGWRPRREEVAA